MHKSLIINDLSLIYSHKYILHPQMRCQIYKKLLRRIAQPLRCPSAVCEAVQHRKSPQPRSSFPRYHKTAMDTVPKLPIPSLRKSSASCPLCGNRLRRNNRATRHLRHCDNCGGTLNKDIECPYCLTYRVWTGRPGAVCHGCGKIVRKKSKPI
jgi:uncharacterized Zn-finger protein